MKYRNKVSVIVPNYNYARYLPERLDSILNQTHKAFEVIVLDDGSTDQSWDIISAYAKKHSCISAFRSDRNSGNPLSQWKRGLELSTGDYVWIAEADDLAESSLLDALLEPMLLNKEIGISFCRSQTIDQTGNPSGLWQYRSNRINEEDFIESTVFSGKELINKALIHENIIANASSALVRKEAVASSGGIDPRYATNGDWHLWLRISTQYAVAYNAEPLNYFRIHPASVISRLGNSDRSRYQEKYDMTMRKDLRSLIRKLPGPGRCRTTRWNEQYISFDYGNKALWLIEHSRWFTGILLLIRSSLYPRPTLVYLVRASAGVRTRWSKGNSIQN